MAVVTEVTVVSGVAAVGNIGDHVVEGFGLTVIDVFSDGAGTLQLLRCNLLTCCFLGLFSPPSMFTQGSVVGTRTWGGIVCISEGAIRLKKCTHKRREVELWGITFF